MKRVYTSAVFFFISIFSILYAQKGYIRGSAFDVNSGEFLVGVTVVLDGTTNGTITDLDGEFNLSVSEGVHSISLSYISYATQKIEGIEVDAGGVTVIENIGLGQITTEIDEVVITAQTIRNTETALIALKKNSANLIDGISAARFRLIGDSDAASTMKRVPGVSVEGGRYVYVRGLGDRYTKTILNGLDLPGLDPDRNTIQMDLFPTNIIDNIIVHKTFAADLPADFTGGIVDIELKDFPEQKVGNISFSVSYNAVSHFNPDFLTYNGGKYDFLGFDDGTRSIPAEDNIPSFIDALTNPAGENGQRFLDIMRSFDPQMSAFRKRSNADYSFGINLGNQIPGKKYTIGYIVGLTYKSTSEFFEDVEFGRYGLSNDPAVTEMEVREFQTGDFGTNNVFVSGYTGLSAKTNRSKIRLNLLHLQNGESKAGLFDYNGSSKGSNFFAAQHNLEYNQRSLSNILFDGKHNFKWKNLKVDWKFSPTLSRQEDPDIRFTRFEDRGEESWAIGTEVGFPERIWRELEEVNLTGKLKAGLDYSLFGKKNRLEFGSAYVFKERDFIIRNFQINIRNIPLTGNPDEFFYEENIWPYNGSVSRGTTYEANFIPVNPNQFNSTATNLAGFVSTEINIFDNLKTIIGVRVEQYQQRYTGQDQQGYNILDNDLVLDDVDLFPAVNIVYAISPVQNIRLAGSQTIARPSFKEMSYAEIFDPLTGRTFVGGLFRDADDIAGIEFWDGNLTSSSIQNFDLRWELFHGRGEMISVSTFYKKFDDPIELIQFVTQDNAIQPRNVGDGQVAGLEFELRQGLGFLGSLLQNYEFNSNITFTKSRIRFSPSDLSSRRANARIGQEIGDFRDMSGQAPLLINAGIAYKGGSENFLKGLQVGLFYNVQGKTLQVVGIADRPDVYSLPFHSLNLNANKRFNNHWSVGLKIDNLLDQSKKSVFESFNADQRYYQKISAGTTFQLRLGYSFL